MAEDRVWPDDFTYGFGGPWEPVPPPMPITLGDSGMTVFDTKRWCIEQVLAARAAAPHTDPQPLHVEARALFDFLFGGA